MARSEDDPMPLPHIPVGPQIRLHGFPLDRSGNPTKDTTSGDQSVPGCGAERTPQSLNTAPDVFTM
jgi:hypothetical protein